MAFRPLLVVLVLPGCFAKPPRPEDPSSACGNAVVDTDAGEICDDANDTDGDGCSAACAIEPWFECPVAGDLCHPITALRWVDDGTRLPSIGGAGGTEFAHECGALSGVNGPNTVMVGIEGEVDSLTGDSIVHTRALCADVELVAADGTISWSNPERTPPQGGEDGTGVVVRECANDQVVTGFDGNAATFVSGIELFCQPVTHTSGALAFGAPTRLGELGPGNQARQPESHCTAGEVVRAIAGRSGGVLDQFTLRCVPTEKVICGDAVITPELETCDDGNANDGDACNAQCNGV